MSEPKVPGAYSGCTVRPVTLCPQCDKIPRREMTVQRFPYRDGSAEVELTATVEVSTCSCGFEWTDGSAEALRDAAVLEYKAAQPTAPWLVEPAPKGLVVTDMLVPAVAGGPCMFGMVGTTDQCILLFSTAEQLTAFMAVIDVPFEDIKRIHDGPEFLASVPHELNGVPLRIIANPWITPQGTIRYTGVFR